MPNVKRYSLDKLPAILKQVKKYKIPMVAIFPYTPNNKKDILVFLDSPEKKILEKLPKLSEF